MGSTNTKILNTLSSNFGGPGYRRDTRKRDTEGTISFRGRSNSLDSISTALSFGTVSQACVPSRCSSLDNLLPGPQSHDSSMQRHTRSHDKQYSLLDNESVSSVGENSEVERQGEIPQTEREIPQRTELTLSLPTSLDQTVSLSCSGTPARAKQRQSILKRREVDEFSDNFVTAEPEDVSPRSMSMSEKKIHDCSSSVTMGPRPRSMPSKSILKDKKQVVPLKDTLAGFQCDSKMLPKLLSESPHITTTLLTKLSPEEWDEVINFACATLGQSLQSSINEKVSVHDHQKQPDNAVNVGKHVTISDEVPTSMYAYDREVTVATNDSLPDHTRHEERTRRKRRSRKERPNSLPPVYLKNEVTKLADAERDKSGLNDDELQVRTRSHSHEGSYYHKVNVETARDGFKGHKSDQLQHYPCSGRTRKRKTNKSKNPNAPVDVSLDDNCPGVARVRRLHRHTHHHSFCDPPFDRSRSDGSREKNSRNLRERNVQRHLMDKEEEDRLPSKQSKSCSVSDRKDQKFVLTLEDMRAAATVIRRSAEVAEVDLASSYPGQSTRKRHSMKLISKHSSLEDEEVEVTDSNLSAEQSNKRNGLYLGRDEGWSELVFPEATRSGRISPATDMAVISLDLNSPSMLEPTDSKRSYLNNVPAGSVQPQMYLHSHNHYHHIIHHTH